MRSTSRAGILLVEDQPTHVEQCLAALGYEILGVAQNKAEALRAAEKERPDVALIDIHLDGEDDGIEAARELRARYGIPIVYLTAHSDEATLRRAVLTEPYGYVVKPFSMDEVRSAIEVALYKHAVDEQLAERERWFSTTLRSVAEAVVACDVEQRVRFMNRAAQRLLGVDESETRGRLLPEVVELAGEEQFASIRAACARALEQRAVVELEPRSRLVRADSTVRVVDGSVAPILHGSSILGAVLVCSDVTEKVRTDEQLALTDRLSALGTLVASVVPDDVLARIFEPFFTTKPHGSGTGLGLSVCRGIVEAFGGELRVESEVGSGSRFSLSFPAVAERDRLRNAEAKFGRTRAAGPRGKILVVDDEPLFRSLIARVLHGTYVVVSTEGAAKALGVLRERRDFDLILCDLMMPEMSGVEFYAEVERRFPELTDAVTFMTGGAFTPESADFVAAHPNRCIQKPFGGDALLTFVARSIARELEAP